MVGSVCCHILYRMRYKFTRISTQIFTFIMDVLSMDSTMALEMLMSSYYELMNLEDALLVVKLARHASITACEMIEGITHKRHQRFSVIASILSACTFMFPQDELSSQSGVPGRRRYLLKLDILGPMSRSSVVSCWGIPPHKGGQGG